MIETTDELEDGKVYKLRAEKIRVTETIEVTVVRGPAVMVKNANGGTTLAYHPPRYLQTSTRAVAGHVIEVLEGSIRIERV